MTIRMKIINNKNTHEAHDCTIAHINFRANTAHIKAVLENGKNLEAIQMFSTSLDNLSWESIELLRESNITILIGQQKNRKVNYDGCVEIHDEQIKNTAKIPYFTEDEICKKYQISYQLLDYVLGREIPYQLPNKPKPSNPKPKQHQKQICKIDKLIANSVEYLWNYPCSDYMRKLIIFRQKLRKMSREEYLENRYAIRKELDALKKEYNIIIIAAKKPLNQPLRIYDELETTTELSCEV